MTEDKLKKTEQAVHILVATPLGEGGKGGIDRVMDGVRIYLRAHPQEEMRITFAATRGGGLHPACALLSCGFYHPHGDDEMLWGL